jgi:hypothetical protein
VNRGKIAGAAREAAERRLGAAALFLAAKVKETVSKPAVGRAAPGAPIRKASGAAWRSVRGERRGKVAVVIVSARSKAGFAYPRFWEHHGHAFFAPTVKKYRAQLVRILKGK